MNAQTVAEKTGASPSDLDQRWRRLDPVFIMGMQRTGTSIIWRALRVAGFRGFPEGHFWLELVEPFARFRDPDYKAYLRQEIFALGSGRNRELEKRFALMIDRFHRDTLSPDPRRWVDKSPGRYSVAAAPMLAELFPQAQFVFTMRNPITTVNSAIAQHPQNFNLVCRNWVKIMETWRRVRALLGERYIEIVQERIVEEPELVAAQLAEFLGAPEFAGAVARTFTSRRENTSFPNRVVGDFIYPVNWTKMQKRVLADVCGAEMAIWGYPLAFETPAGPEPVNEPECHAQPMDWAAYYNWFGHQAQDRVLALETELEKHRELLHRIGEGRVMQLLNKMDRILVFLGFQHNRQSAGENSK